MPVERVSKGFKDISMSFQTNPVNLDLIGMKDNNAISRSLRNLVLTYPGERFFNPDLGSKVSQSLFDNLDDISAASISDEIEQTIVNYEPRVNLTNVKCTPNYDNNAFDVTISYTIVGVEALPQQLTFALQATR